MCDACRSHCGHPGYAAVIFDGGIFVQCVFCFCTMVDECEEPFSQVADWLSSDSEVEPDIWEDWRGGTRCSTCPIAKGGIFWDRRL